MESNGTSNFEKFYSKALHFLSFRPRSEKELRDYLKKKNADDLIIRKIINSLIENKFLDDKEFAKWFIEQRTTFKPKAVRIIKSELKRKGITEEIIDDSELPAVNDLENAMVLARKRIGRYKNEDAKKKYEKMVRFLSSRGFDWDTIKEVIDRILPKEYN